MRPAIIAKTGPAATHFMKTRRFLNIDMPLVLLPNIGKKLLYAITSFTHKENTNTSKKTQRYES